MRNINDKKAYITTDMIVFKIIKELYVTLFYHTENLNEMDYFLRKYEFQNLIQEQLENVNRPKL